MNVVLGIDGGGTRTRASIIEGERVSGPRGERIHQAADVWAQSIRGQPASAAQRGLRPGWRERRERRLGRRGLCLHAGVQE